MANQPTVFVTGGSDYVGQAVIRGLRATGAPFYYSYRSQPVASATDQGLQLDLTDAAAYAAHHEQLAAATVLVHTAAIVSHSPKSVSQDIHDQLTANFAILEHLVAAMPNLQKIVYVSSCSAEIAAIDPSFYGLGKQLMEAAIQHLGEQQDIAYINLRFPQLYGPDEPHGTFTSAFINSLLDGTPIKLVNNGSVVRDILHVDDAAGSILHAIHSDKQGTFTISDPESHTIRDVLDVMLDVIKPADPAIENTAVPEAATAKKSFHFTSTADAIGYSLRYNLRQGLEATINQWRRK